MYKTINNTMREITRQSVQAFYSRKIFTRQNMKVRELDGKFYLKLHNNIIAILHPDNTLMITDAGWSSNTTKERLNGLQGVNIHQKNFEWFLNNEPWNGELIEIKH